jgi:secretion/DNA translocation related TadE-like protein
MRECADVKERGSGSVLAMGGAAVIALTLVGALQLEAAVASEHLAQAAADLGALAGADAVQKGAGRGAACAMAARIAEANGAAQETCVVGGDGSVLVTTEKPLPPGLAAVVGHPAEGIARAGPGPR